MVTDETVSFNLERENNEKKIGFNSGGTGAF